MTTSTTLNNCCYKLRKCIKWQLVTAVIFFSAWDKSHVSQAKCRKPSVKINIWSTNFSRTGPSNFTFAKVVFQAWGFDTICFFITNCAVWANSWAIWTSNFLISNKAPKSKKNLNANLENYINKLPVFTGYTGHNWNFQDCSDKQNWTPNLHCLHCIH